LIQESDKHSEAMLYEKPPVVAPMEAMLRRDETDRITNASAIAMVEPTK
jgi:hypothetical protein